MTDNQARVSQDRDKLVELGNVIGSRTELEGIRFAKRLGEKWNNVDPRLLLVGFKDNNFNARLSILDNARKLADDEDWKNVNVVLDLTPMQRKEEEGLRKEAERLNGLLSETDAKNWVHKVVGRRGERRLVRVLVEEEGEGWRQQRRGRRGGIDH